MGLRSSHGKGAQSGPTRVEVSPVDELPEGTQAPVQAHAGRERDEHGRFVKGARSTQARGGRARKNRTRLAAQLGLEHLAEASDFQPYITEAEDFAHAQCKHLSEHVGGGEIGPDVGAIVQAAAWQLAASRYLNASAVRDGGNAKLFESARRLADSGRQNLIAARELAAKGAQDRAKRQGPPPIIGGSQRGATTGGKP